jgi:hypothetical protein
MTQPKKTRGRPSVLTEEERTARRREKDRAKSKRIYAEKREAQIEKAAKESSTLRSHPDGLATLLVDVEREDALSELQRCEVEPVQRPILPKPILVDCHDDEPQGEPQDPQTRATEENGDEPNGKMANCK